MLTEGNSKLGRRIFSWSLPVVKTCPGASAVCLALCYATQGFFNMPSVGKGHRRNLTRAEGAHFVRRMVSAIRQQRAKIVRIHVAGDFYSRQYIQKWIDIVDRSPETTFYAYTRSWRVKRLQTALQQLATRPNMSLWLSTDAAMCKPPAWAGCRTAYLSQNDRDLPRYKVDLVFRDEVKSVMKHTPNGSLVCPFENGASELTCRRCKLCFAARFKPPLPSSARGTRGQKLYALRR